MRRPDFLPALLIATVLAFPARAGAQQYERPTWKAGDKWTYARKDKRTAKVSETWRTVEAALPGGGYRIAEADRRGRDLDDNFQPVPPEGPEYKGSWWTWPMRVGNEWSWEVPIKMQAGNGKMEVKRKIAAFERIMVPAGEFECYRIESVRTRYFYDARAMSRPNYSSRTKNTEWLCPSLRFLAREDEEWLDGYGNLTTWTAELVSFHLAE